MGLRVVVPAATRSGALNPYVAMTLMTFFRCCVSAIAFWGAAHLAYAGRSGWGWLILAGIVSAPGISVVGAGSRE